MDLLNIFRGELNVRIEHLDEIGQNDTEVYKELIRISCRIDQLFLRTMDKIEVDLNTNIFAKIEVISKEVVLPIRFSDFVGVLKEKKPTELWSPFHQGEPLFVISNMNFDEQTITYSSCYWEEASPKTISFSSFYRRYVNNSLKYLTLSR